MDTLARTLPRLLLALVLPLLACDSDAPDSSSLTIVRPEAGQLSLVEDVRFEIALPAGAAGVELRLDGAPVDPVLTPTGDGVTGSLGSVPEGSHVLSVQATGPDGPLEAEVAFETVALDRPDTCDVLNNVECVLPFPSSRFLENAEGETATSKRVVYPADAFAAFNRLADPDNGLNAPPDPTPLLRNDGFSPTPLITMHFGGTRVPFPGPVDWTASNASVVDPDTRFYTERGLEADSPTVLVDLETGERINHFVENDVRATDETRVAAFLRANKSLTPGHRYAVAVRNIVHVGGASVEAEAVFAALRDGRPTDIPAVEERRERMEWVLKRLGESGVPRDDLVLAFDFQVASDESLTREMLHMRDTALEWIDQKVAWGEQTFTVDEVFEISDCSEPEDLFWRRFEGTFQVPNFLDKDPFEQNKELSQLQRDAFDRPVYSELTNAPYGLAIPCSVVSGAGDPQPATSLLLGHGLFGNGRGFVRQLAEAEGVDAFDYAIAGTNWSGLSSPDISGDLADSFIFQVVANLDNTQSLPDRLRQGMTNTLVLSRMLRNGAFNLDPAYQRDGKPLLAAGEEIVYFGASLGGINGTWYASLTNDATLVNVDVPAINFSFLLPRATPFLQFELLLGFLNPDAMAQALGIAFVHELWVRGEPAGFATHVTENPLPGSIPKQVLMTVALFDQQVSNLGSVLSAATLGLGNLEGSAVKNLPGIPDVVGPQSSGIIIYDTGSFDPSNPDDLPFIPPITNLQPQSNGCDPHGRRALIPASLAQLSGFLETGVIDNFCTDDGICNASEPFELPFGDSEPCDPQNP